MAKYFDTITITPKPVAFDDIEQARERAAQFNDNGHGFSYEAFQNHSNGLAYIRVCDPSGSPMGLF